MEIAIRFKRSSTRKSRSGDFLTQIGSHSYEEDLIYESCFWTMTFDKFFRLEFLLTEKYEKTQLRTY